MIWMRTALRILSYLRKYWLATLGAYLCLICATGVDLAIPWLIRQVIDCGIRVGLDPQQLSLDCQSGVEPHDVIVRSVVSMVVLVVVSVFQVPCTVLAQDSCAELEMRWGRGLTWAVAVDSGVMYYGSGTELVAVSTTTSSVTNPTELMTRTLSGPGTVSE